MRTAERTPLAAVTTPSAMSAPFSTDQSSCGGRHSNEGG